MSDRRAIHCVAARRDVIHANRNHVAASQFAVNRQLLTRDDQGRYHNSEDADLYLDASNPSYLGGSFMQYNARDYGMWGALTDSLRSGRPRTELHDHDHF